MSQQWTTLRIGYTTLTLPGSRGEVAKQMMYAALEAIQAEARDEQKAKA